MSAPATLRLAELAVVAWRNGGGVARELARDLSDARSPGWRVSIAELEAPGPFSSFPGLRRHFTVIGDRPVHLDWPDRHVALPPFESVAFEGDEVVSCRLPDGVSQALNLIHDPKRWQASLAWFDPATPLMRDLACDTLLVVVTGEARLEAPSPATLNQGDAWQWDRVGAHAASVSSSVSLEASPRARLIRIDLKPLTT
ncbi:MULTISPECIES: HutD family protein [Halomonadaceae]|uniref:HutD/Ves family protein n=1 Tax=Halomonadaceae TaxID=28256 RepID=UPI001598C4A9|nr:MULTISPECIES: HutD family protein [Halomonas]QJQ93870.1 hypothetical protein HIO72_00220 [Halomonas sp. PA5]